MTGIEGSKRLARGVTMAEAAENAKRAAASALTAPDPADDVRQELVWAGLARREALRAEADAVSTLTMWLRRGKQLRLSVTEMAEISGLSRETVYQWTRETSEDERDERAMTLTEFLLAQIAEDEAAAHDAGAKVWRRGRPIQDWDLEGYSEPTDWDEDNDGVNEADPGFGIVVYDEGYPTRAQAEHIARWDPARVLAECEAKRRIVGSCSRVLGTSTGHERAVLALTVLRALALPYAAHPEYQEAWRP